MGSHFDILIIGAGPAGLMLSTCLARWGYTIKQIDKRPESTQRGQADAIQPRCLELLRSLDLKSEIMAHGPFKLYEISNWGQSLSDDAIHRTSTHLASPQDVRYPFVTVLAQGTIESILISSLARHSLAIDRPWTLKSFKVDRQNHSYPVTVDLEHIDGCAQETIFAKYLIGADGAKSFVRQIMGVEIEYKGVPSNVWGVIDGLVDTDFPDIRIMCNILSREGSVLLAPRENGLVRFYVHLASDKDPGWARALASTESDVKERVKTVLRPYYLNWELVDWFSIYPIRQGVTKRYSLGDRIFLVGDACHVHSKPKAAQGMNTGFLDSYNLAWKIHLVEQGFAERRVLKTYEQERRHIAQELIKFDEKYAQAFSQCSGETNRQMATLNMDRIKGEELAQLYKEALFFVSGYGVSYQPNIINWSVYHPAQSLALGQHGTGLRPGIMFLSSTVSRVTDANPVSLHHAIPENGSFKIFIFAGKPECTKASLVQLADYLAQENSFLKNFSQPRARRIRSHKRHNPHSLLFTICVIFAAKRQDIDIKRHVPGILGEYKHHIYADDRANYNNLDVNSANILAHKRAGIDESTGAVLVVRPDGYVSAIARLTENVDTAEALSEYFTSFCGRRNSYHDDDH
ncbi:phenol 2-monooxygenase [Camillea tinctor]|nr:phenol 2-monooxygenase [Camillea tinctor]